MTYSFNCCTITTWLRPPQGDHTWQARVGDTTALFTVAPDANITTLHRAAVTALGDLHPEVPNLFDE